MMRKLFSFRAALLIPALLAVAAFAGCASSKMGSPAPIPTHPAESPQNTTSEPAPPKGIPAISKGKE